MTMIRSTIFDGAIAAVNAARPVGIPECLDGRDEDLDPEQLPALIAYWAKQLSERESPLNPTTDHVLMIVFEIRTTAATGKAARAAAEEVEKYLVTKLVNNELIVDGKKLVPDGFAEGETVPQRQTAERPYFALYVGMIARFTTRADNAELRV